MNLLELNNLTSEPSPSQPMRKSVRSLGEVDHLIQKIGIGIVDTVERYYTKYTEKPNEVNAKAYCLWRLRLHRRVKNDVKLLEAINDARNLGLHDDAPGKTCWEYDFG